jgi:hypothetical protein
MSHLDHFVANTSCEVTNITFPPSLLLRPAFAGLFLASPSEQAWRNSFIKQYPIFRRCHDLWSTVSYFQKWNHTRMG